MPREFLLAEVRIRPDLLTFERAGSTISVEPKVMDAVLCLAARPGETVTRESMMAAVWPDVHVSDDALNRCIWKLRRALDDDREAPRFVATVQKRGYRLVAPVVWSDGTPGGGVAGATTMSAATGTGQRSGGWIGLALGLAAVVAAFVAMTRSVPVDQGSTAETPITSPGDEFSPLTSLNGYESAPAISPDGRLVAFHHYRRDGTHPRQFDLMIQPSVAGEEPVFLTDTAADEMFPAWSPDSTTLAFVQRGAEQCQLIVRAIETGTSTVVAGCDPGVWSRVAWRSDGAALFMAAREPGQGPSRIVQVLLADNARVLVTDPPLQDDGDREPTPSPDGRHLAFVRSRSDGISDVYVTELESGLARRLTFDAGRIGGLAWSAGGGQVVFGSDRLGPFRLWAAPIAGGDPTLVPTVGHNASSPAVSGVGPTLVYEEWKSTIDIRTVSVRATAVKEPAPFEARPLVVSTQWDTEGRWSPDGSRMAFLSNRGGATDVWIGGADGASPRRATNTGAQFSSWLRWSPDGRRVAFAAPVGEQLDIHVLEVGTGVVTRATLDSSDERWPAWSPDGQWLYFGSNRGGQWNVWRQSIDGGPTFPVTTTGGLAPAVSSDGRDVYYAKGGALGLWRKRLGDDHADAPVPGVVPASPASWDLGPQAVYFVTQPATGGPVLVRRYDLGTGTSEAVAQLESSAGGYPEWFVGSGISVSGDGRHLVYSSVERSDSDLWIVRGRR